MAPDTPYENLSPEAVLDALESAGFRCDGRVLALNSYENRVYQIGIEEGIRSSQNSIGPGRWTDAAILEEHAFSFELAAQEIPVVAPLAPGGPFAALPSRLPLCDLPRRGGRWPELGTPTSGNGLGGSWAASTAWAARDVYCSGRA